MTLVAGNSYQVEVWPFCGLSLGLSLRRNRNILQNNTLFFQRIIDVGEDSMNQIDSGVLIGNPYRKSRMLIIRLGILELIFKMFTDDR